MQKTMTSGVDPPDASEQTFSELIATIAPSATGVSSGRPTAIGVTDAQWGDTEAQWGDVRPQAAVVRPQATAVRPRATAAGPRATAAGPRVTAIDVELPPIHTEGDQLILAMANWHKACALTKYKDSDSKEFRRDRNRHGVYVIIELTKHGEVPLFVEAVPCYAGMSSMLSQRLRNHARGIGSNPAEHVTDEYLERYPNDEYPIWSDEEQRAFRERCMAYRNLWVKTAHTADLLAARSLEKAVIRLYESQGINLWNKIRYETTPPFPNI